MQCRFSIFSAGHDHLLLSSFASAYEHPRLVTDGHAIEVNVESTDFMAFLLALYKCHLIKTVNNHLHNYALNLSFDTNGNRTH